MFLQTTLRILKKKFDKKIFLLQQRSLFINHGKKIKTRVK